MSTPPPTPLQEAQAALGAAFGEREGRVVVDSYGDPEAEYRAARERAGLVWLSERALLEASGPQRQKFLQGMLSNDVASRTPGQGCRAALMTPKGALLALARVLVEPEVLALELDAERVEPVQRLLERHRVAAPVRFAPRPDCVLALLGPRAGEIVAEAGLPAGLDEPEAHASAGADGQRLRLVRAGDLPGAGFVIHAAPEIAAATWERLRSLGARPLGREALDALRVEALRPWYGWDVSEANLLHETGLVSEYHSARKGCYVGQEIVARLEGRGGNVNKALRGLRLSAPARARDVIRAEGREVGHVTTAAVSPRLGPIAMGYLQRSHFAAGTAVELGGAPASVVTRFEPPA